MVRIVCVESNGTEHIGEVEPGTSVMQAVQSNGVPGLIAECGGACACATCHVYVDDDWAARLPNKGDSEDAMLEAVFEPARNSRLSCQIILTEELDGLVVRMPRAQV